MQVNQRIAVRTTERMQWEAEQSAIRDARRQEEESFDAIKQEFGMDGGEIREVLTLWQVRAGVWHVAVINTRCRCCARALNHPARVFHGFIGQEA